MIASNGGNDKTMWKTQSNKSEIVTIYKTLIEMQAELAIHEKVVWGNTGSYVSLVV
jgi:hypothetical protein